MKNDSRLDEADALLRRAISLREDNVDAYQNRGSILVRQRRYLYQMRNYQFLS